MAGSFHLNDLFQSVLILTFVRMPFLSLTSDFGIESHYVGICKMVIHQLLPEAEIMDITHSIKAFSNTETIYFFQAALPYYPPDSAHFILTNLYSSKSKQLLYAYENYQHIFCVDNGLMPQLFGDKPSQLYKIKVDRFEHAPQGICNAFTHALEAIWQGDRHDLELLSADQVMQTKKIESPYDPNYIKAQVIYIDRFENIILDINRTQFEESRNGRNFNIELPNGDKISKLSQHYGDVSEAESVAFFNGSGHLEIALNHSNAAGIFGFLPHNVLSFNNYRTLKITFA